MGNVSLFLHALMPAARLVMGCLRNLFWNLSIDYEIYGRVGRRGESQPCWRVAK